MSTSKYITSYCRISPGKVVLNHQEIPVVTENTGADFVKAVYKGGNMNYPKFYKMDHLCKLAFVASELLLKACGLTERYSGDRIGITISNSASSLDIDTEHQASITDKDNFFPSPAVFVYTLPNILIGEIAIRNSIKGENSLFIFENFNPQFMTSYNEILLATGHTDACISGYVDFHENNYQAFLYSVEHTPGVLDMAHTSENLTQLFNKKS